LFGTGCASRCNSITISGSGVTGRNAKKDWLADYFGLPRDYQSTLCFSPQIKNIVANFNTYFGFDNWYNGLFLKIDIPVVYTQWHLNFVESCNDAGTAHHHPGYFNGRVTLGTPGKSVFIPPSETPPTVEYTGYPNAYGVARSDLAPNFTAYACNKAVPKLGNGTETIGLPVLVCDSTHPGSITTALSTGSDSAIFPPVTFLPLCKARFTCGDCSNTTKIGIADLHAAFGLNAFSSEKSSFGFGIRAIAPTGNTPEGRIAFEPMIGNGKHWGLGTFLAAQTIVWQSEDEVQRVSFSAHSNIVHLFNTTHTRTFDLKNKPNSRYMLVQKMKRNVQNVQGDFEVPCAQFADLLTPLANISTLDVNVSVRAQTDTVFMLSYQRGTFILNAGYNLWTRSCEHITLCSHSTKSPCSDGKVWTTASPFADGKTWALKGDAQVYGYAAAKANAGEATNKFPFGVPLSASQSDATIYSGTNGYTSLNVRKGTVPLYPAQNPGIDNPQLAANPDTLNQRINDNPNFPETGLSAQVKTSINPIFITEDDLDIDGNGTQALSHKLFATMTHSWTVDKKPYDPYISLGIEGEFHKVFLNPSCSSCNYCGASQWGLWMKGGIAFD